MIGIMLKKLGLVIVQHVVHKIMFVSTGSFGGELKVMYTFYL